MYDLSTPKGRVEREKLELNDKLYKLTKFIISDNFKKLKRKQRFYLVKQQKLMVKLVTVLEKRLKNWGDI